MSAEMELRARAARIAGQAELKDVRTRALHADMKFPPHPGSRLGYRMAVEFQYTPTDADEELAVVEGEYRITMFMKADDADEEEFAEIHFILVGLYEVPAASDGEPYTEEEWEAFAQTTGQFALYPYAREAASMLTTRLGVPPLTLGMLRVGLDREEVVALEHSE